MFLNELVLTRQASQKNVIFHYWYFLDKGFKFKPDVCNGCHGILMMSMNISDIAILNIHSADYRCIIGGISTIDDKLNANIDWTGKSGTL